MPKQTRAQKLAAHFRRLKEKRQLKSIREKFKPTKRERDSFVFVDTKGKRRDVTSRAQGFLFYVDKKGKAHAQNSGGSKTAVRRRYRDFDLSRSRRTTAREKWEAKWNFKTFGSSTSVSSRTSVGMPALGSKLNRTLQRYTRKFGTGNLMVVEMAVHTKGRIVKTQFLLTGSELKAFARGKRKFLPRLAWKAMSTELAMLDLVASTSADFIRRLASNRKKRKGKWTDSRGDSWGKAGYKSVKITRVDIRIKVSTKKHLK